MKVKFKRERTGGVQGDQVTINGEDLTFHNDEDVRELDANRVHQVCWLLIGPVGAALKVTMTALGADQMIVDAKIGPQTGGQVSDCRLFWVTGATS